MKKFAIIFTGLVLVGTLFSSCGVGREICPAYSGTDTVNQTETEWLENVQKEKS